MKFLERTKTIAIILACIAIIAIIVVVAVKACSAGKEIAGGPKTIVEVKPTPVDVDSIRSIGQWSVVEIAISQIVDTVDRGFFSDDKIEVMYHGTLHYGIDMTKVGKDWVRTEADSVVFIHLPDVTLLDNRFLDERDVKVILGDNDQDFINRPEVREALVAKAKAAMIKKGDTRKEEARRKVESELQHLFKSHGYKQVMVFFGE